MSRRIKGLIQIGLVIVILMPVYFLFFQKSYLVEVPGRQPKLVRIFEFNPQKFVYYNFIEDIEKQKPLKNPPAKIKAVYFTAFSAGNPNKINYLINLADKTEINAVVIDIKDYSGYIAYPIELDEVNRYQTRKITIPRINSLIKRLHDRGIYLIARITVFQDPALAKARPDLTIKDLSGKLYQDKKDLFWVDPSSQEVWDYILKIAIEAKSRGFDELNFDYVRFPAENSQNLVFPFWDRKTSKRQVIKSFFEYLSTNLKKEGNEIKISADLFGQTMVSQDDSGIGQIIEDAFPYFDYICPMLYPSHFNSGFLGFENPAEYPYEVVKYSMEVGLKRLSDFLSTHPQFSTKIRPWIQDFDLGAIYDQEMVNKQIKAITDSNPNSGWMLWSPRNIYSL